MFRELRDQVDGLLIEVLGFDLLELFVEIVHGLFVQVSAEVLDDVVDGLDDGFVLVFVEVPDDVYLFLVDFSFEGEELEDHFGGSDEFVVGGFVENELDEV